MQRKTPLGDAVWILAAMWVAFGFCMQVASPSSLPSPAVPGSWLHGIALATEAFALLLAFALPRSLAPWYVFVVILSVFALIHVVVLCGILQRCGCFGRIVMPDWVALAVNATLVGALALYKAAPAPRWATAFAIAAAAFIACFLTGAGYADPPIAPRRDDSDFRPGQMVSRIPVPSPALSWIALQCATSHGLVDVFIYDPSCSTCLRILPLMRAKASQDARRAHRWLFVDTGEAEDLDHRALTPAAVYRHIPDATLLPPLHLQLQDGVIRQSDAFSED